jgi:hypothetical protein
MSEFTREDALAFIESMRLTLFDRVGFRWMVEKLTRLATYIEATTAENDQLNAYIDRTAARADFEAYRATCAPAVDHSEALGDDV